MLKNKGLVFGDEEPLIRAHVTINALIWAPVNGALLKGSIYQFGYDYLAVRVLGLWNAVIPKSRFPQNIDSSYFLVGEQITFRIFKYVDL